jgi:hypothetical protein
MLTVSFSLEREGNNKNKIVISDDLKLKPFLAIGDSV